MVPRPANEVRTISTERRMRRLPWQRAIAPGSQWKLKTNSWRGRRDAWEEAVGLNLLAGKARRQGASGGERNGSEVCLHMRRTPRGDEARQEGECRSGQPKEEG